MFVRASTYERVLKERNAEAKDALYWTQAYLELQNQWNKLVDMVNRKGGNAFLEHGVMPSAVRNVSQFTDEELRSLLRLVHPDKHNGRDVATKMFQKIQGLI